MSSYILWLMPTQETAQELGLFIQNFSAHYHTPVFEPHLTLLAGIEGSRGYILERTQELVEEISCLQINFTQVSALDTYYQSLFLLAEKSDALLAAYWKACEFFEMPKGEFMPHVSLLYGHLSEETKQEIRTDMGDRWKKIVEFDRLCLVEMTGDTQWDMVAEFPLWRKDV